MRGRPKRIVTNDECKKFNILRQKYVGKTLDYNEVVHIMKTEMKWGCTYVVNQLLHIAFTKVSYGKYLISSTPVYIGKLQSAFDIRYKTNKKYRNAEVVELTEEEIHNNNISAAIKLLKKEGYKVTKESFDLTLALRYPLRPVNEFITVEEF